jgi:hypothetical protein
VPGAEFWKALPSLNGPQLWVALIIVLVFASIFFFKYLLAPGAAILASNREDKRGEAEAWKWMAQNEKEEKEALLAELSATQTHLRKTASLFEYTRGLLFRVLDSCQSVSQELRDEANALPRSADAALQEE